MSILYDLASFLAPRRQKLITNVRILNKQLARELEQECRERGGVLTFGEYLTVTQFGGHGYHNTKTRHGMTEAHGHWAEAVALLCQKTKLEQVVEFGSGDGQLALHAVKAAQKTGRNLSWACIEINEQLREKTAERFRDDGVEKQLRANVASVQDISMTKPCLGIFSYSLDSIPPEIVIQQGNGRGYPDAFLGVTISGGILNEVILSPEALVEKHIDLGNGIYKDTSGLQFDLRSLFLSPGQRAFLPLQALVTLSEFLQKLPVGSRILILDEFSPPKTAWDKGDLFIPKNLLANMRRRECRDYRKLYAHAGEQLLYYLNYGAVLMKVLHHFGCYVEAYDVEQELARTLIGKSWFHVRGYSTYGLMTLPKVSVKPSPLISLQFPQRMFF